MSFERPGEDPLTLIELEMWAKTVRWRFASTARFNPHSYTLKSDQSSKMFVKVVEHMRKYGYVGRYGGTHYEYYDIGAHTFWTMGRTPKQTQLVNRKKREQI